MRRVAIVFTGGTIATMPDAAAGGNTPALDGAAILGLAPELTRIADLEPIDWGLVPASHLRFSQLLDIAKLVDDQLARDDVDGAVVVQGTDTMEESAFAFALLLRSAKPVAVTGAMRDSTAAEFDGQRNLADAVRWAASVDAADVGAVVVMGGRVLAADDAVKTHPTALDTFRSRSGRAEPSATRGRRLPALPATAVEDVHLVTVVTGMDGSLLRGVAPARPSGVVVAATGSGNTSADLLSAAQELMALGASVALTTRCPTGAVAPSYAFPGGGVTWQRAGALISTLDGPRTRVALALGIGAGLDRAGLQRLIGP